MATKSAEHQEFADPNTCKKLDCKGRPCTKCHMCCDWHFTGNQETWRHITNWKNWTNDEWKRFYNDRIYKNFMKRDGATCRNDIGDDYDGRCGIDDRCDYYYGSYGDCCRDRNINRCGDDYSYHLCVCELHEDYIAYKEATLFTPLLWNVPHNIP
ncbi:unnamed protein product [Adineta steineri]|uniref:Uncharacterized protein n=1 Tax=Adineta steineri TaxID=433720 RepID=A0A814JE72_9BILA|nr:unnamed protein product [Adineta steineri]CAF1036898.1 unnamed protein product [Adineta steineri]CAF1104949.1 unnamed protein product [Adineta steineri]